MEAINVNDDGALFSGEDVSISSSLASAMLSDQDSTADIIHAVDEAVAAADAANLQIALEAEREHKEKIAAEEMGTEIEDCTDVNSRKSHGDDVGGNGDKDGSDGITTKTNEDSVNSTYGELRHATTTEAIDREKVLRELKKHNDMVLEEHKRSLEAEFQSQMQNFISTIKNSISSQQQQHPRDVDMMYARTNQSTISRGRTPVTPQIIEERNDRVLTAARNLKTAPKYQVYENDNNPNEATAVLRAKIEEPSPPKVIRMSVTKGEMNREIEQVEVAQTREEAYAAKMEGIAKSMPHLSIYNELYDGKDKKSKETASKRKKTKQEDFENTNSSSQSHNDKYREEIDDAELMGKVDNVTRHMMLKTKFLFEDSKKFINKTTKRKKKSKTTKSLSNSSSLPSIDTVDDAYANEYEDDIFDKGGLLPSVWSDTNPDNTGSNVVHTGTTSNHGFSRPSTSLSRPSSKGSQSRPTTSNSMSSPTAHGGVLQSPKRGGSMSTFGSFTELKLPKLKEEAGDADAEIDNEESIEEQFSKQGSQSVTSDVLDVVDPGGEYTSFQAKSTSRYRMNFLPIGKRGQFQNVDSDDHTPHAEVDTYPDGWFNRRVNNIDNTALSTQRSEVPELQDPGKFRHQWENELARHILSVYATTQVTNAEISNTKIGAYPAVNSKVIMDFVDSQQSVDEIKEDLFTAKSVEEDEKRQDGSSEVSGGDENSNNGNESTEREKENRRRQKELKKLEKQRKKELRDAEIAALLKRLEDQEKDEQEAARFRKSTKIVDKNGKEVIIRGQPKVFPIWFTSTGAVYSDWSLLPGGVKLQAHLKEMYEKGLYEEYLEIVQRLLEEEWTKITKAMGSHEDFQLESRRVRRQKSEDDTSTLKEYAAELANRKLDDPEAENPPHLPLRIMMTLWRQLILTSNAMASIAVQNKKQELCNNILRKAEEWSSRRDVLTVDMRKELKAYVNESMAYFYYRKKNYGVATRSMKLANAEYESRGENFYQHVAVSKLRIACIEAMNAQHKAAHSLICEVIGMVEDGSLAFAEASPEQLCIVSVAYHNLAVAQLKLKAPHLACESSMNARKIARLCLSHSNRWMSVYQYTHEAVTEDLKHEFSLQLKEGMIDDQQLRSIKGLIDTMFDPNPKV